MDGGVLAVFGVSWRRKRQLTVTFQTTIPFGVGFLERREMVGGPGALKGVCLELVKRSFWIVRKGVWRFDDRSAIRSRRSFGFFQLESLILAQNERWRQA